MWAFPWSQKTCIHFKYLVMIIGYSQGRCHPPWGGGGWGRWWWRWMGSRNHAPPDVQILEKQRAVTPQSACQAVGPLGNPTSLEVPHQLLKAKLCPPSEARQFGPESQRRPVINSSSLLTSLGLQQPHLQTQIWPCSAKLGVAGGLCRCFSALWRLSALMATLSPSSSSFPSPGGCLGLPQLLAWFHFPFFSNYNEVSYRGLESLEEGRSFSQYTLTVRSWFQEWTWNIVFFSWWFQGETSQVF